MTMCTRPHTWIGHEEQSRRRERCFTHSVLLMSSFWFLCIRFSGASTKVSTNAWQSQCSKFWKVECIRPGGWRSFDLINLKACVGSRRCPLINFIDVRLPKCHVGLVASHKACNVAAFTYEWVWRIQAQTVCLVEDLFNLEFATSRTNRQQCAGT